MVQLRRCLGNCNLFAHDSLPGKLDVFIILMFPYCSYVSWLVEGGEHSVSLAWDRPSTRRKTVNQWSHKICTCSFRGIRLNSSLKQLLRDTMIYASKHGRHKCCFCSCLPCETLPQLNRKSSSSPCSFHPDRCTLVSSVTSLKPPSSRSMALARACVRRPSWLTSSRT